ncbi:MAG: hypothetical protein CFE29_13665 [Bradyrhizobiaceae bacterium PARB1]|jgi:hypothetical protein|nr:MAG: hypothetical protein CFE29_13665 [Bradyrhizobiaceae bacterium PARB1]
MSSFRRQWLWPIALAVATIAGLVAALIGESGLWWALSWLMLAVPLAVMAYCLTAAKAISRRAG